VDCEIGTGGPPFCIRKIVSIPLCHTSSVCPLCVKIMDLGAQSLTLFQGWRFWFRFLEAKDPDAGTDWAICLRREFFFLTSRFIEPCAHAGASETVEGRYVSSCFAPPVSD